MSDQASQPVRGFRDLLFDEASRMTALENLAREVLSRYGFREVRVPIVELRDLFIKATGETTDIVEKEMFQWTDQGGRNLALRPEGTPGIVRAYIANHLSQRGGAAKLLYLGSMFRAERPQKGRYREFGQIGIETIGNPHPNADIEAILGLRRIFDAAGLKGRTRLRMNNLGCEKNPSCRPKFREDLRGFLNERRADLCESCLTRIDRNPLRALDCKRDGPKLAAGAPRLAPCADCRAHVDEVSGALKTLGIDHLYPDAHLVRGLDYYNRTVFEFQADGIGSQDAIAGGGRYDGLVASMGGPDMPAVGWALGIDRTLLAVEAADPEARSLRKRAPERPLDVFVIVDGVSPRAKQAGYKLLETFRAADLTAGGGLFAGSKKAQLKEAKRSDSPFLVVIADPGDAEAAGGFTRRFISIEAFNNEARSAAALRDRISNAAWAAFPEERPDD